MDDEDFAQSQQPDTVERLVEVGRKLEDGEATEGEFVIASSRTGLAHRGPTPLIVRVHEVPAEDVAWLWPGKFPLGKISLLVGDPGRGKSLLALDVAARLSAQRPWPDGSPALLPPSSTILVSAEDDLADTIRPRLDAADADPAFIHLLRGVKGGPFDNAGFVLPRDRGMLRKAVEDIRDVRLIVLDPLVAFLTSSSATNNVALRTVLASLQCMAEEFSFAVLAISHLTKASAAAPIYRAMGSIGLVAAARAVWTLWPDADNHRRTFFVPLKCNLSEAVSALAYTIAVKPGDHPAPNLLWEANALPLALVSTSTAHPLPRLRDQQAIAWLADILKEGPVAATQVETAAGDEGFGRNVLRRAKAALNVITYPEEFGKQWLCRLP
jgi:hypothetical protein